MKTTSIFCVITLGLFQIPSLNTVCGAPSYTLIDLGTLGGGWSQAIGVNDTGQVVGYADTTPYRHDNSHAFLYNNGSMFDLGTLGGYYSCANAINARGEVVGVATTADNALHAFLYRAGVMIDTRSLPGCSATFTPLGINGTGHLVGQATTAGQYHGFLYANATMTDLGTLGGTYSTACGINDRDEVVGFAYLPNGDKHAFLYTAGTMHDLGTLGGAESFATAINGSAEAYRRCVQRDRLPRFSVS